MLFSSIWRRLYLGCSRFVEIFHSAPFKMKRARRDGNMQMRIQIFADGTLGDKSFNPQNFSSCFQSGKNRKYEVEHIVSNLSNFHYGKVQGQAIYSPMGFSCTCVQPCAQNIENRLFDAISIIIPHFTIILRMWPWNSSFFIFRNQNMEVWLFQAIPAVP